MAGCCAGSHAPARAGQVELPASSKLPFMNKKVTFADRVGLMQAAVQNLRAALVIIEAEAKAMAEAQERFAVRKAERANPTE